MVEFRMAMASIRTHKGLYSSTRPRQTCADSGSDIRSPQPNRSPPLVLFHQSWIYIVGKQHSGEADQLTLAIGGSEHPQLFSVAISWGNKMNFSLHENMARQSYIYNILIAIQRVTILGHPVKQIFCFAYTVPEKSDPNDLIQSGSPNPLLSLKRVNNL